LSTEILRKRLVFLAITRKIHEGKKGQYLWDMYGFPGQEAAAKKT
jgi:hypothetical protein